MEENKATGQFKGTEHNAVLAITVILHVEEPDRTKKEFPVTKGGMRCAIAGALVVT